MKDFLKGLYLVRYRNLSSFYVIISNYKNVSAGRFFTTVPGALSFDLFF